MNNYTNSCILQGEDMRLIDNRETLKFTASDRQLAGIYECWAVNGVGEPAKAQIELNIICKKTKKRLNNPQKPK